MVSAASSVCSVEKTRWPDSAACSAVWVVSSSRSSPIRITSGSWRSTRRSACLKDSVSSPTSRWLTIEAQSSWMNSIGSSIVTMCCLRFRLIQLSIAASDVDLPEPVAPVTRTRPRCSCASLATPSGRPRRSKLGISLGTKRKANEMEPRWRKPLTRKRPIPSARYDVSRSPDSRNCSRLAGERSVTSRSTVSRSDSVRSRCSTGCRSPSTRTMAGEFTLRCMSLPPASMTRAKSSSRFMKTRRLSAGPRGPL